MACMTNQAPPRQRLRQLGLSTGILPPGPYNAITDITDVKVGHVTLIEGETIRTGVTAILPHGGNLYQAKVPAGLWVGNGYGKLMGSTQISELGEIETPIALTNTLNVWRVADALVDHELRTNPEIGITTGTVNPVVGECNDGYLNDIQGRHVTAAHVQQALATAAVGPVTEGAVGAGTGTTCYGWKGGIGTASRSTPAASGGFTLGALVQTNFGHPEDLRVGGVLVESALRPPQPPSSERGSVMVVLATDAPLEARQLHRLCVRAGAGLARTGATIGHGSGDFVIAFSTTRRIHHEAFEPGIVETALISDEARVMEALFPAVVEAVEEAVLNSLFAAETVVGRDGHVRYALPTAEIAQWLAR